MTCQLYNLVNDLNDTSTYLCDYKFLSHYLFAFQGLKLKKQRSTGDLDRKGVIRYIFTTCYCSYYLYLGTIVDWLLLTTVFSTTIVVTTVTVIVTNNYTGNYSLVTTGTIADCLQYRYGGTIVDCLLT